MVDSPMKGLALVAGILVVAASLAGCADEAPAAEPVKKGSNGPTFGDSGASTVPAPRPKGTSERWHFHDYWNGHPVIEIFNATVTLNATVNEEGVPVYGSILELDRSTIVPPEAGKLTFRAEWATPEPGPINLSYRPADSATFVPFGDLLNAEPADLPVTESMADVPHRQESWWRFNLSAPAAIDPNAPGAPKLPPREMIVSITATIGRPLFIDPPHLDWWVGGDLITLVESATGEFTAVNTPLEKSIALPGTPPATVGPRTVQDNVTIPVDEGRIVPEGAKSIVVLLNWTSTVPGAGTKLGVQYEEANYPSGGPLEVAQDGASSRVFVIPVTNGMTDTTYSNRTTWVFHVIVEGNAAAFQGTFTMFAWATRYAPADALRETLG